MSDISPEQRRRLILCDFDGTLVGADFVISPIVKKAIQKWTSTGNLFALASGRMYDGLLREKAQELQVTTPCIARGGAEISDPLTDKVLFIAYLPEKDVEGLMRVFTEHDIAFWAEGDHTVYTATGISRITGFGKKNSFSTFDNMERNKIAKMGVYSLDDEQRIDFLENTLTKQFHDLHLTRSHSPVGKSWDITIADATKFTAAHRLLKILNIDVKDTIAIGDGYNDFPLLTACGYKIAMGNAHEELKAIADFVTLSYQEDGVAVAIEHLLSKY